MAQPSGGVEYPIEKCFATRELAENEISRMNAIYKVNSEHGIERVYVEYRIIELEMVGG